MVTSKKNPKISQEHLQLTLSKLMNCDKLFQGIPDCIHSNNAKNATSSVNFVPTKYIASKPNSQQVGSKLAIVNEQDSIYHQALKKYEKLLSLASKMENETDLETNDNMYNNNENSNNLVASSIDSDANDALRLTAPIEMRRLESAFVDMDLSDSENIINNILKNRIFGFDSWILNNDKANGQELNVLLQLMRYYDINNDELLYVTPEKAIKEHFRNIGLCQTISTSDGGLKQKDFDKIEAKLPK